VGTATIHATLPDGGIMALCTVRATNDEEAARGNPLPTCELGNGKRHAAVLCAETGDVMALTGPADDAESRELASLYAAAPKLRDALRGLLEHCERHGVPMSRPGLGEFKAFADARAALEDAEGANDPANYPGTGAVHPLIAQALAPITPRGL
jgi:hypothetical protein